MRRGGGGPQVIQYALGKSFAVGKEDGTFEELKRKRDAEREQEKAAGAPKKKAKTAAADGAPVTGTR